MTDRPYAATAWEAEAERRREVLEADALARIPSTHPEPGRELFLVARGRRLLQSIQRGSVDDGSRQAGRLNQKRV